IARKKILLAEDNEINQRLMKSLFLKKGIEITIVENGELVLKKLKNEHFDIILMDCQMPVMDGYEATKAIRTELHMHTIPIVALTANIMLEHKQKALACGMDDIIGKPFDFDNLLSVLANLLLVGGETNTSTTVETKTEPFNQKKTTTVLVDFKKGLKTTNNIQDLFIELLTVFIKNYHPNIFSAKVSSQHQMSTLLHELKSVSASIGAIALSKRCDHYEQLNKSEHLSEAHYKELKALLQTTNAEIKSYITYHSDDNNRNKPSSQEV
ncbi:MAG: response regulator, partial [Psychromonas sp.]